MSLDLRSTLSGLVTACFALSVLTRAVMPGCLTSPGSSPAAQAPAAHHDHPHDGGHSSNQSHCPLHLCCANLSAPAAPTISGAVLLPVPQRTGFIAPSSPVRERPAHFLPFATAPPLLAS